MQYKCRGIILKRTNLGEADRIITIFTDKFGKIRVVAKGVRKTLSRMAGHLEPFCLTRLELAEGKNLDVITGAQVEKCFLPLRSDLEKTNASFYFTEVIDKMVEEREPHSEIYHLLDDTLEHINDIAGPLLKPYFEINFLTEMGMRPELYSCLHCNEKITSSNNNFDFSHGGLVCENCGAGFKISDNAIKMLRLFLKHQFKKIKNIKMDQDLIAELNKVCSHYLKHFYQKDFKSERYLSV